MGRGSRSGRSRGGATGGSDRGHGGRDKGGSDRVLGGKGIADSVEILHSLKQGDAVEGEVGEGMVGRR